MRTDFSHEKTLILCDGGVESLLACAYAREAATLAGVVGGAGGSLCLMPFVEELDDARIDAILRQAELFGCRVIEPPVVGGGRTRMGESLRLAHAVFAGAEQGCERVVWPASGAFVGGGGGAASKPGASAGVKRGVVRDELDVDRVLMIQECALAVTRLVGLSAGEHGIPGIYIDVAFAALSAAQIAELLDDLELGLESCWFEQEEGLERGSDQVRAAARAERGRWRGLMTAGV